MMGEVTIAGHRLTVVSDGSVYLFHSGKYGFVACANRLETGDPSRVYFKVNAGNRFCRGGVLTDSRVISGVSAFIRRRERERGAVSVTFGSFSDDLADARLDLSRGFKKK